MTGIAAVSELRMAFQAAVNGDFRNPRAETTKAPQPPATSWEPTGQVVGVLGCLPGAGASTVALAIASGIDHGARIVECCTVAASGLAAASSAELGVTADGWVQGSRGESVLIERRGGRVPSIQSLPAPSLSTRPVTILDSSWDIDVLLESRSWLGELARALPMVVVVTRPTIPGMRRLEAAIGLLGSDRVTAVIVGADKRLPKPVEQALGPRLRSWRAEGRLVHLPHDHTLSVHGLTPDPLPSATVAAGVTLKGILL